jgi:hypothetical protein
LNAFRALLARARQQAAERGEPGPDEEVVKLQENSLSSTVSGAPLTTVQKYFQHQQHFREYAAEKHRTAPEDPLWRDCDIVNQSKILAFTQYWCKERKNKSNELITLKRESNKGIISALMDLYKQQKSVKVVNRSMLVSVFSLIDVMDV